MSGKDEGLTSSWSVLEYHWMVEKSGFERQTLPVLQLAKVNELRFLLALLAFSSLQSVCYKISSEVTKDELGIT